MNSVQRLRETLAERPLRIAVLGDCMTDEWITAEAISSPEECPALRVGSVVRTPGGAANAARQLQRWRAKVMLLTPHDQLLRTAMRDNCTGDLMWDESLWCPQCSVKQRYVTSDGRVLSRHDVEPERFGWRSSGPLQERRDAALHVLRNSDWDAALLCDYAKGWFDHRMIVDVVTLCQERGIPVVADPKRSPNVFAGAILKCNNHYMDRHLSDLDTYAPVAVVTWGPQPPSAMGELGSGLDTARASSPVLCVNHVGAGDCFAAHLTLALAARLPLEDAVALAHAAGRVYVQHPHGRPPWPHEIARDLDPAGGKVILDVDLAGLRRSISGRIVFTNGVFRIPHAGHAWLLRWARQQGDVLVVGVNDDPSARKLRKKQHILPLAERCEILASQAAVDWIVPFGQSTPEDIIEQLRPDVLVKGADYRGASVPGGDLVNEVRFAPDSPYPNHCSDLETSILAQSRG